MYQGIVFDHVTQSQNSSNVLMEPNFANQQCIHSSTCINYMYSMYNEIMKNETINIHVHVIIA